MDSFLDYFLTSDLRMKSEVDPNCDGGDQDCCIIGANDFFLPHPVNVLQNGRLLSCPFETDPKSMEPSGCQNSVGI